MASGSFSKKTKGYTVKTNWSSVIDIAGNFSTVTCDHYLICDSGWDLSIGNRNLTCTAGEAKSFTAGSIKTSGGTTHKLGTTTHKVPHNNDGTKSVSATTKFSFQATISGQYIDNITATGTIELDDIPRASSLTASNGTLNTKQTLTINRASDTFSHTIKYVCGTASGTIVTKTTDTSIDWTPPLSLASQNTTGTSVSITLTLTTYNHNTGDTIGTSTKTIACSIPDSVKPTCSVSVSDPTGYKDTYGGYIQGLSKFKVTVSGTVSYGSSIDSYRTTANGSTYTSSSFTTGVIIDSGTQTIAGRVTDKRGRSGTNSTTATVLAYSKPKIDSLSVNRCNADGTENMRGEYVKIRYSCSVTSLNGKNKLTSVVKYKKTTDPEYIYQTDISESTTASYTNRTLIISADSGSSYDIEVSITDNFDTIPKATSVSTGFTFEHYKGPAPAGRGKNLFDSETWYEYLHSVRSSNMTKETVNSIEYYKFRPDGLHEEKWMEGQFKENAQYTFSAKARKYDNVTQLSTGFNFTYTDGTDEYCFVENTLDEYNYTFTSAAGKTIKYIALQYYYNNFVLMRDIMLEEGPECTRNTSNLFNQEHYTNDSLYTAGTYKYTKMSDLNSRTVVGKNLFNINGNVNVYCNNGVQEVGGNIVSDNVLTATLNTYYSHNAGQRFTNLNGKTFTVSAKVLSVGTGHAGYLAIYEDYAIVKSVNISEGGTGQITYTGKSDNIIIGFATASGENAQFTDIQVELGATATSYVPFGRLWFKAKLKDNPITTQPNVWDGQWEVGALSFSNGTTLDTYTDRIRSKNFIPVDGSLQYYLETSAAVSVLFYDANKNFISYTTKQNNIVYINGASYVKFEFPASYGTVYKNDTSFHLNTNTDGVYVAISESAGEPYTSGIKTAYAMSEGQPISNNNTFGGVADIYLNIYPNTFPASSIFNKFDFWISTDDIEYVPYDFGYEDYIPEILPSMGLGKLAELEGGLDIGFKTRFTNGFEFPVLNAETDLNDVRTPNFYVGANISSYNYSNCPLTAGTFYLNVAAMGAEGQVRQTITSCSKTNSITYERYYYEGSWGEWSTPSNEVVLYYNESGNNNGQLKLAESAVNFKYIEVYYMDNNSKKGGYTKVFVPSNAATNSFTFAIDMIDASGSTTTYIRRSYYLILREYMQPTNTSTNGYVKLTDGGYPTHNGGTNFLYITKVVGIR